MNASLLSVRPLHARHLFSGAKTVELRRRAPRVQPGHVFFIYESAPTMAVRGYALVEDVSTAPLPDLWQATAAAACVTHEQFSTYFANRAEGSAITLSAIFEFERPITLREARALAPRFHPPQSWVSFGTLPGRLQNMLRAAFEAANTLVAEL